MFRFPCLVALSLVPHLLALESAQGAAPEAPAPAVEVTVDTSECPELADWAQKAARLVREWYPRIVRLLPSDGFRPPGRVKLVFRKHMRGVAYTTASTIFIAADWLRKHPDDFGMVVHELTHVVQAYPPGGPGWLVEGIADHVRFFHYEPGTAIAIDVSRASYRDGYRTTARFLAWLERRQDRAIVSVLNAALRQGKYSDRIFRDRTGKSLDELWSSFIQAVRSESAEPTGKGK